MKTQMRFQKYICLAMIIVGALALAYSFCYATGGLATLGYRLNPDNTSMFDAAEGKYDATLYIDIQAFNDVLMYCGIVMIVLAVCLYITSCNKRRNYYVTNFVATGVCAGGNIIMSIILMIYNGIWMGRFNNIDFASWAQFNVDELERYIKQYEKYEETVPDSIRAQCGYYSESTAWFSVGFVVYALVIVASILLILNLVWKLKLMQGEKRLLNGSMTVEGGAL